jgi:DNA polymerase I-like protein with 3'-5' exonuclease and polymerase domains
MNLITLDFETYYDGKIGLGFRTQTTEEYINDPRFEVVGVGVQFEKEAPMWISGTHAELKEYFRTINWETTALLCHNALFDGAILNWIFGITPHFILDTLCMARALHGVDVKGSLASLAERYQLGVKGEEVIHAEGKRRVDFTEAELARYGEYCKNDVALTHALFRKLSVGFPPDEFHLIDMTIRMFTEREFKVDDALLVERLEELRAEKLALLGALKDKLECADEEEVRKKLASNKQFAELLLENGVEPPMKTSPTTGKPTLALAKTDEGFIALTEHEDPFIQQLCAVRLGTKSTIEESRIQRFIDIGARNRGLLPIPLKYYGAHTGRWSGMDKVNFHNLPSRDKKKKTLKNAVIAPPGYMIINCDSSQIEARTLAWLAGQADVVEQFAKGEDVYSIFASSIYNKKITKENPIERFVGKTCILGLGYGTGALKLQHTLKTQPPGANLEEDECKRIVNLYRESNSDIVRLWRYGDTLLGDIANWNTDEYYFGENGAVMVTSKGIKLPNGLHIKYPGLKFDTQDNKSGYVYYSRNGPSSIWGGGVVENVVQALARIIVGEQMLRIWDQYKVKLTVHDSAVVLVPESRAEEALAYVIECMSTPPEWARGLPVACEAKIAYSYGQC